MKLIHLRAALGWLVMAGTFVLPVSMKAHAARPATVIGTDVNLLKDPAANSQVLGKLAHGERVSAANFPISGFYKIRSRSGKMGYVAASVISVDGSLKKVPTGSEPGREWERDRDREHGSIRLVGGFDFFSASDVNAAYTFDAASLGFGGGLEAMYFFWPRFGLVLRAETFGKSISASAPTTGDQFSIALSSLPIMVGAEYDLYHQEKYWLDFSLLAGLGLGTKLTSTVSTQPAPNVTQFGGSPLTFLAELSFGMQVYHSFGVLSQLGYRVLQTAAAAPDPKGNGGEIFTKPLSVNLSGAVLNVGIFYIF